MKRTGTKCNNKKHKKVETCVSKKATPVLQSKVWVGAICGLILILMPHAVRADNLSVLVFPVVIWPVGLLLLAALVVLWILLARKLSRNAGGSVNLALFALISSPLIGLGYTVFAIYMGTQSIIYDVLVWAITLLPVSLTAGVCMVLGYRLMKKSTASPRR